jgi:hypothetical protein
MNLYEFLDEMSGDETRLSEKTESEITQEAIRYAMSIEMPKTAHEMSTHLMNIALGAAEWREFELKTDLNKLHS